MELTFKGDAAIELARMVKGNAQLAALVARHYAETVEPSLLGAFLLPPAKAAELLARQIQSEPEATLNALQAMAEGRAVSPRRRGRPAKAALPEARLGGAAAPARPARAAGRRRNRLSPAEDQRVKTDVLKLLSSQPEANRKQITAVAGIPTNAIYQRVMGELLDARLVVSRGEKAKRVYALAGGAAAGRVAAGPAAAARVDKVDGRGRRPEAKGPKTKGKKGAVAKGARRAASAGREAAPNAAKGGGRVASSSGGPARRQNIRYCPVPGCQNRAAPRFGMVCRDHKDLSEVERERLFAARRSQAKA